MERHLAAGKRQEVARMFGRLAGRYDLANTLLSLGQDRRWRRAAARALLERLAEGAPLPRPTQVASGERITPSPLRILDFCAGTGAQGLAILRQGARQGRQVRVLATDLALPMLQRLTERRRSESGDWRRWGEGALAAQADAEAPPVRDGSLDGAAVAFGIRNVDGYARCLEAVAAALRPGGILAVLEFSMPRARPLRLLYRFYFRHLLPLAGRLFFDPDGAYTYLPDSVDRFPAGAAFAAALRRAGLEPLSSRPLSGGIVTLYLAARPSPR